MNEQMATDLGATSVVNVKDLSCTEAATAIQRVSQAPIRAVIECSGEDDALVTSIHVSPNMIHFLKVQVLHTIKGPSNSPQTYLNLFVIEK